MLSRVDRERRRRRINRQIKELLIQRRLSRGLAAQPHVPAKRRAEDAA